MLYRILLCVTCLGVVLSQILTPLKGCPRGVKVQPDFDVRKYMGLWYEQERYFAIFQFTYKCGTAHYTLRDDGSVLVNNTGYVRLWESWDTALGSAVNIDPSEPAKLGVSFDEGPSMVANYWVLSTDYTNHSVVWSCIEESSVGNSQNLWILSRAHNGLPESKMAEIRAMLEGYGIDWRKLYNVPQNAYVCPGRNQAD